MLYTPLTKKALRVCFEAHKDQVDKSGTPYVFHPFHLAEQMETEETVVPRCCTTWRRIRRIPSPIWPPWAFRKASPKRWRC